VIVLVLALLLVAAVPLTGGRLSRLGSLHVRRAWLPPAAVAAQVPAVQGWLPDDRLAVVVHLATYVVLAAWLWLNRGIPGLGVAGAGGIANLAAIATNGGVMPAAPGAVALAAVDVGSGFANSAPTADAPLWFLGDVFAIPAGWPLANVFSAGDVLLLVGLAVLLHRTCGRRYAGSAAADRASSRVRRRSARTRPASSANRVATGPTTASSRT
jgi:hypothetical protein